MRRRFHSILLTVSVASLCLIGLVQSLAQESPEEGARQAATTFVLRVNPEWADRVNAVLKRVAEPSEVALPAGMTLGDLVHGLCAGHAVATPEPMENEPGKIRLFPCVHIVTGVKVTVREGNTLEAGRAFGFVKRELPSATDYPLPPALA
jgi:hypothetical protein